jgi:hypothetical protein
MFYLTSATGRMLSSGMLCHKAPVTWHKIPKDGILHSHLHENILNLPRVWIVIRQFLNVSSLLVIELYLK